MAAFESLCQRYGVRSPANLMNFLAGVIPSPAGDSPLSAEEFDAATERARRMSLDEAIALALEIGEAREAGAE